MGLHIFKMYDFHKRIREYVWNQKQSRKKKKEKKRDLQEILIIYCLTVAFFDTVSISIIAS